MNAVSMQYRLEQPPIEHIVLPPIASLTDDMQVVEHDVEEITIQVPDWDQEVIPIIH